MRYFLRAACAITFVFMPCLASSSSLLGPKGEFSATRLGLEYDPSRYCVKPYRPYEMDKYERETYLIQAKAYIECMSDAAKADQDYALEVIADGYKEKSDEFLREVRGGY